MRQVNFPALTGIRILAAYMVYLHHFNPFKSAIFGANVHYFFDGFHVGVTLFFVLSGFLITHRYYDSVDFDFKSYLQKRFSRIYPLYFILTSFTYIVGYYFFKSYGGVGSYFLNITFLRGFFDDLKFSGIAQGWTLTVEEFFYFLAPLFFILIKKSKCMVFLIPFFFVLLGVLLVYIFQNSNFYGFMNNMNFMLGYTFFGRIFEFFSGIALGLLLKKKLKCHFRFFTVGGVFGILFSIYFLSILENHPVSELFFIQKSIISNVLLPVFGIMPLFYGLIKEKTAFSKVLGSKFFILLGKSSYVFYLIHIGLFRTFLNTISTNYFFIFISLNGMAIVLYFYVEKPLNSYFRKI